MQISKKNLERALEMALSVHWENGLPKVRAKLRLAINSLLMQSHSKFPQDGESLHKLLRKRANARIRNILRNEEITVEAFAFAIRDALS